MDGLTRSAFRMLLLAALVVGSTSQALAEDRSPNVSDAHHEWFAAHIDEAMPYLLQTAQGPIDPGHISIVEELGNWGAARAKGKHQGNDFVLDFPHEAGSDSVQVGSILAGRVVHVEHGWGSYGNTVFIQREIAPQAVMIYAHLASIDVEIGDAVSVGEIVGDFGCTGNCRGLSGKHVRNQVHVEVYAMDDAFTAADITWDTMPMGQLRNTAVHERGQAHGVDVRAYFDTFELAPVTRAEHGERYAAHAEAGGFAAYLADEDVASAMALAAEPPEQEGTFEGDFIPEPSEDDYYYADTSLAEDLIGREIVRHGSGAEPTGAGTSAELSALAGIIGDAPALVPTTQPTTSTADTIGEFGRAIGARVPSKLRDLARRTVGD